MRWKSERATFFVLLAVSLLVLMFLVAVVLAIGFHTNSRAKFQNITNLAALAAVEQFFRDESTTEPLQRAQKARERVREIMSSNTVLGTDPDATDVEVRFSDEGGDEGSTIRFGLWHSRQPEGYEPADCAGVYPCFEEVASPNQWISPNPIPVVNAIRIETRLGSPVLAPLGQVLGEGLGAFLLETTSTVTIVPRCSVFLMDASLSTTNDSHPSVVSNIRPIASGCALAGDYCDEVAPGTPLFSPPYQYVCPRDLSLFAFNDWISFDRTNGLRWDVRSPVLTGLPNDITACARGSATWLYGTNAAQPTFSQEGRLWCNLMLERMGAVGPDACLQDPPAISIRQTIYPNGDSGPHGLCYELERTPYGQMLIDKCRDPEPLASFMLGFNAGVRMLQSQKTAADRVRMSIFRGAAEVQPFPPAPDVFTTELGALVQLTNINNRGVIDAPYAFEGTPSYREPELHPNFIDQGWFPIMQRGTAPQNFLETGTNILEAIEGAITALSDPAQCPAGAQKSIILATDGVSTCDSALNPRCGTDISYYRSAEQKLLIGDDSVRNRLRGRKIALTTLIAGRDVQPNVVSREREPGSGEFLEFRDAVALGYRGLTDVSGNGTAFSGNAEADPQLLTDSRPVCQGEPGGVCPGASDEDRDAFAFSNLNSREGVLFRRPNGVMAQMSIDTGGIYCPLMAPGDSSLYWDHDGNASTPQVLIDRDPGDIHVISPVLLSPGERAAECVRQTLGGNPFALVEE